MKKLSFFIAGLFLFLFSLGSMAQTLTGASYFEGSWNVNVQSPIGAMDMLIDFELDGDNVVAKINDSNGDELYKVTETTITETQAIIKFIGSQGAVSLVLKSKDENNVSGSVMGAYSALGKRVE